MGARQGAGGVKRQREENRPAIEREKRGRRQERNFFASFREGDGEDKARQEDNDKENVSKRWKERREEKGEEDEEEKGTKGQTGKSE